jgi:hypothetical protein
MLNTDMLAASALTCDEDLEVYNFLWASWSPEFQKPDLWKEKKLPGVIILYIYMTLIIPAIGKYYLGL